MSVETGIGVTRRDVLVAGGTLAGYAIAADPVLAQAIKTDTQGITAGDHEVKIGAYAMPVYEAKPSRGAGQPVVLVISEIWGAHEYIKDTARRFAKEGFHAPLTPHLAVGTVLPRAYLVNAGDLMVRPAQR